MNKKQKAMLYNHINATAVSLFQLYDKPSQAKQIEDEYCQNLYREKHGYNMRYHSANTYNFVFSFKYRIGREEFLQYETSRSSYSFKIADIDDYGRAIPVM